MACFRFQRWRAASQFIDCKRQVYLFVVIVMSQYVIVTGYPKSGNTWVTRLVAECLMSPVVGFYGEPENPEEAVEGCDRTGSYKVYKSHELVEKLVDSWSDGSMSPTIIYVVRDCRDVVLSAERYFSPLVFYSLTKTLSGMRGSGLLERIIRVWKGTHLRRVWHGVSKGVAVRWLEVPWDRHVLNATKMDVVIVKYEDLLEDAEFNITRCLSDSGLPVNAEHIKTACRNQDFNLKKTSLLQEGDGSRASFLRVGEKQQWLRKMPDGLVRIIVSKVGDQLRQLGYHVDN